MCIHSVVFQSPRKKTPVRTLCSYAHQLSYKSSSISLIFWVLASLSVVQLAMPIGFYQHLSQQCHIHEAERFEWSFEFSEVHRSRVVGRWRRRKSFSLRAVSPASQNPTRIWHVPAKHANRMDARAHTSTLVECAPRFMTPRSQGFVGQSSPNLAHV